MIDEDVWNWNKETLEMGKYNMKRNKPIQTLQRKTQIKYVY